MADTSVRLVDDTFPENVPVRQWVLSLPMQIRYRLAHDGKLLSDVLRIFLRVGNAGPQLFQAKVATPVTVGIASGERAGNLADDCCTTVECSSATEFVCP